MNQKSCKPFYVEYINTIVIINFNTEVEFSTIPLGNFR